MIIYLKLFPHQRNERNMPLPLPKTKFSELLEELSRLAQRGASLSSLTLQRFKREAQSIMKVDAAEGYLLLGILAGFEGRIEDMHHFHELAIQLSPGESNFYRNYAASLFNFRFLREAVSWAKKAYERFSDPRVKRDALDTMIKACDLLGNEEEFLRLCEEYETLTGEVHPNLKLGINENETNKVVAILSGNLNSEGAREEFAEVGKDLLSKVDHLFDDARE